MKIIKTLFFVLSVLFSTNNLYADIPHFIDFKYILNESEAGKKAQTSLKNKLNKGIKNLQDKEKKIQDEEKKIIQQKKVISKEEYKKKLVDLRAEVSALRNERNKLLESVAKQRANAKNTLLKNLNPILKDFMNEKKIRMVVDKKNILYADDSLDITKDIIVILNKKLKSIPLK